MRKIILFSVILFIGTSSAFSQTAVDSVKMTINSLFIAMKNSDSQAVFNCFADSAIMQTIARDGLGNSLVKTEPIIDFVKVIAYMPKDAADERAIFDMIKIDGPLATVWMPYKFYLKGKFSHCGVNSFQMVRKYGKWKIQYLIDTRRTQPCE